MKKWCEVGKLFWAISFAMFYGSDNLHDPRQCLCVTYGAIYYEVLK